MDPDGDRPPAGTLSRAVVWFAQGFGLGRAPVASGTFGSLWGVLLVVAVWPRLAWPGQALLAAACALLAWPVCDLAERALGRKDDGRIVADEFLTFPICMIGLPVTMASWWILPAAFLTFRLCDIVKPPPAAQAQKLEGGAGVVADDVIAALYSLGINHLLYALL